MTTNNQQAALEKRHVPLAYFAEFHFSEGVVRVCNSTQNFTWGGFDWAGLGALGQITDVEESDSIEARPLNFTLNVADPSLLALAVGPVAAYRGRDVKLYMCPLDDNYRLIDSPELCWRGEMDMMGVSVNGGSGQITLRCETSANRLRRRPVLRLNPAQHKQRHPGDTGLDYLPDLIANPQTWLSIRFQEQR